MPIIKTEEDLARAVATLDGMLNRDPQRAIQDAYALRGKGTSASIAVKRAKAAFLIDAGTELREGEPVRRGISILRQLRKRAKDDLELSYNLARGLGSLARLSSPMGSEWYSKTHKERREARRLYREVTGLAGFQLGARALTNLGSELHTGHRWCEAYDCWVEAIALDASNPVASTSVALMLIDRLRLDEAAPPSIERVAAYYCRIARLGAKSVERIAGMKAAAVVRQLPVVPSSWRPRQPAKIRDELTRFAVSNRLALFATVEGIDLRRKRWDDVHLPSISERVRQATSEVPPIFAMFNQLKADFCSARWLAFVSEHSPPAETAVYFDTLDYAKYGQETGLLLLAQRAAIDLLDRIAVCTNDYFKLGRDPKKVTFLDTWETHRGPARNPALRQELERGNPGLIALGDLATDLRNGGPLELKTKLRHESTHRFCVLHDLGSTPSRECPAVEHYELDRVRGELVATLQVARSAILYLRDAIMASESRRAGAGLRLQTRLIPHHEIRGE